MGNDIFLNLPTEDLERSKAFWAGLGADFDPNFTDDNAACVVLSENLFLMVVRRDFFATFTDKTIIDPRTSAQTNISFSCGSREEVDAAIERGVAAGGTEPKPAQDYGFMYSRDLDDPDGNSLGYFYMTPEGMGASPAERVAEHAQA